MATFSRQPALPPEGGLPDTLPTEASPPGVNAWGGAEGGPAYDVLDEEEAEALHANAGRPYLDQMYLPRSGRRHGRRPRIGLSSASAGRVGLGLVVAMVGTLAWLGLVRHEGYRDLLAVMSPMPAAAQATPPLPADAEPGRSVQAAGAVDEVQRATGGPLRLQATAPPTARTPGSAVLGGVIVRHGQTIAGYRLVQINPGWVVLQKGNALIALRVASDPGPAR